MTDSLIRGTVLDGKYALDQLLGQGGMGAVYRATHLGTRRTVALKLINPRFSNNTEFISRFRREAEAAGRLRHPNVVDVTDFGFADTPGGQVAYLVMEYLDGCTLGDVLAEEHVLQLDWVVDVLEQACSAVDYAHRSGIIHRDLKPENIWLEPNRRGGYTVKVLDFGLVKFNMPVVPSPIENYSGNEPPLPVPLPSVSPVRGAFTKPTPNVPPDTGPNSVKGEAETLIRRSTDTSPADTLLEQSTRINRSENDTLIKAADGLVAEEAGTLIQHTDQLPVSEESEYRTLLRPSSTGTVGRLRHTTSVPQSATDRSLGATATAKARFSDAHGGARDSGTDLRVGIATDDAGGLTRVGAVMGTPLYMSPEQCRGEALDSRSDVYSLGVIAYRMLCGDTPFSGTLDELLESHASVEPVSPRARNRKVPRKVARVVMSALSKDPQDRPASAAGFASALRAAGEGTGKLLRQSVSLYSEHFPAFLRLSLLAYAPLVLILAANKLLDWLLPMEKAPYIEQVLVGIGGAIFAPMVGHLLAYCIISGVTVPIVIQTNVAPLRPLLIRTGFARLRERWKPFLAASLIVVTVVFFASLLIIPGIIAAVCFGLYAPVVIMEGLGVRATLMRSFQLSRRSWFTVLVTTALQFGLPILVLVHFNDVSLKVSRSQVGFNINISDNLASEASQLLNVFISPLTAVMIALLYLKTRHAGGETLKDAERALDSEYQPRSRWEERMRSRSLTGGSAGSSPR